MDSHIFANEACIYVETNKEGYGKINVKLSIYVRQHIFNPR